MQTFLEQNYSLLESQIQWITGRIYNVAQKSLVYGRSIWINFLQQFFTFIVILFYKWSVVLILQFITFTLSLFSIYVPEICAVDNTTWRGYRVATCQRNTVLHTAVPEGNACPMFMCCRILGGDIFRCAPNCPKRCFQLTKYSFSGAVLKPLHRISL